MRPRAVSLLAGTASVLAIALAFVVALTAGCGSRPGSPEELFARIAELNAQGDTGRIWDLLTDDAREREMKTIDDFRVTLDRNPGVEGLLKQFNCTKEEFRTLSYVEIYRRENLGKERVLVDAKIKDKHPDPSKPGEVILTVENALGATIYMRMREVAGGWGLVQMMPRAK